jgi:hypothetical protein
MVDEKKSFQFNIKVSISHMDNSLKNAFMVRLIRGRDNGIYNQYQVVNVTSTADNSVQGWVNPDYGHLNLQLWRYDKVKATSLKLSICFVHTNQLWAD